MSTTHSSFDQYCISHKTINHRAAAAPGPEVHRESIMTKLTALPLLATIPGDATELVHVTYLGITGAIVIMTGGNSRAKKPKFDRKIGWEYKYLIVIVICDCHLE